MERSATTSSTADQHIPAEEPLLRADGPLQDHPQHMCSHFDVDRVPGEDTLGSASTGSGSTKVHPSPSTPRRPTWGWSACRRRARRVHRNQPRGEDQRGHRVGLLGVRPRGLGEGQYLLQEGGHPLIFANVQFDILSLETIGISAEHHDFWDICTMAVTVNEDYPKNKGLDTLGAHYCGEQKMELSKAEKADMRAVPFERKREYAARDAELTYRCGKCCTRTRCGSVSLSQVLAGEAGHHPGVPAPGSSPGGARRHGRGAPGTGYRRGA